MKKRLRLPTLLLLLLQITVLDSFHNVHFIVGYKLGRLISPKTAFLWQRKWSRLAESVETSWDPYMAPKLDYDECYYSVIEADPHCDIQELKRSYYKVVFKTHPDGKVTAAEKSLANKQMMVVNHAYKVLRDPLTRAAYDKMREKGFLGAEAGIKGSNTNDPKYAKPKPAAKPAAKEAAKRVESSVNWSRNRVADEPGFADRVRQAIAAATATATGTGQYWERTNIKRVTNRGDGSLAALKVGNTNMGTAHAELT
jgi:hypothetical protein